MSDKVISKRTLLVVDVQEGLLAKKLYEKELFLSTIQKAIAAFRKAGETILFVRHVGAIVKRGTPEWEIYSGLDRLPEDPIIDKQRGNAFDGTCLADLLEGRGVGRVAVCGLVSHGCVRASCLGAQALGYGVDLLAGGHSNWAKDAVARIEATERDLAAAGIETLALDRLLDEA